MLQRIAQRVSSTLAGGAHTKIVINRHVALNLGSRAVGQRDNSQIKSEGTRFRKQKKHEVVVEQTGSCPSTREVQEWVVILVTSRRTNLSKPLVMQRARNLVGLNNRRG